MTLRVVSVSFALALGAASQAAGVNLLVNGGFETGDFAGWTRSGNPSYTGVFGGNPHSGAYGSFWGPEGSEGYISQTISTTIGQEYEISFWHQCLAYGSPNSFSVTFGGSLLDSQQDLTPAGWVQESYRAVATNNSTTVTFGFRDDPEYIYADDFSVQAVPEPTSIVALSLGSLALIRRRRNGKA